MVIIGKIIGVFCYNIVKWDHAALKVQEGLRWCLRVLVKNLTTGLVVMSLSFWVCYSVNFVLGTIQESVWKSRLSCYSPLFL